MTIEISRVPETDDSVLIKGAILSYANIWKHGVYKGKTDANFSANLLFPLADPITKKIHGAIMAFVKANSNVTSPDEIAELKFGRPKDKRGKIKEDLKDFYRIQTNNPGDWPTEYVSAVTGRTTEVNLETKKASDDANVISLFRGGTIVNCKLAMNMGLDNDGNPKLWIKMLAIQWVGQGPSYDGGGPPADDGFAPIEGAEAPAGNTSSAAGGVVEDDDDLW